MGQYEETSSTWTAFKIIGWVAAFMVLSYGALRYESRLCELEMRLQILESESILFGESKVLRGRDVNAYRTKREANPDPGQKWPRRNQGSYVPNVRAPVNQQIVRNDEDETFFTRSRNGGYVRPSGLREMWERLPEESMEVGYQAPPIDYSQTQTRQSVQTRSSSGQVPYVPPVQTVGLGNDQVSARVIRYNEAPSNPRSTVAPIAGHFVADVSNFTANENPRLRNSNGIFQIWRPADWMTGKRDFLLDTKEGVVTVKNEGLYHIYAQIHYQDEQDNSFLVDVNGTPLLQCTTQSGFNSCFTAGLTQLRAGDRILIKNIGVDRFSIYKPEKSFFGLVKIGH